MDEIEVPEYFLCPISLQILKDPVTTITGITYERESIEQWLKAAKSNATCPVTKQSLPRDSELTPNHTLRRLIQSWCTVNAICGVDRIPTPKSPIKKSQIFRLLKDLDAPDDHLRTKAVRRMEALAKENERNRTCMVEAGVTKAAVLFIIKCFKEGKTAGLEEILRILYLIWNPSQEIKLLVRENQDFIDSLTWILSCDQIDNHVAVKTHAMLLLHKTTEIVCQKLLGSLKVDFFKEIITRVLRKRISKQAIKSSLLVLAEVCPWGRNRMKIVEANAVFELIELELEKPEKNITELIFNILAQLCSCADGRQQFLKHAGSIAMLSKRVLRVSPATDDRAVRILDSISKFSAGDEAVLEMLRVGAVSKLCMVIQADCAPYLKKKAREILRLHSHMWNNSPCIAVYLLTRYPG
ncbi:PREDICTED: E3 ubiquitin-protein ligase PUB24-like [Populus euphratica]|uniref:U-box domain-containing protein n=1 Tax=Populus euphratica TaxID=75702 RepID=A0AAJ6TDJ3_POPEU|nr:PREDICTED: E3 ubiquitin-protein ligase PUB24-like [Populus euphratica]